MKSEQLFQQACQTIPGGVNSPVRAFKAVGGTPIFFEKAQGAYLFDADGKKYIDYVGSWGPALLGHAHPEVIQAVKKAAENGLSFGAPTELEIKLAEKICEIMPSIEKVRMVNSGTEATMSAIRLARGFTKKNKIIKFIGCYHGHSDSLLVKAGSGALTFGCPSSAGVTPGAAADTLLAEFNNLKSVKQLFTANPNDIAAIIVEPVAGNMNCILPEPEFLPGLRELCDQYNAVLIFDEVMTGFRVALGGAQAHYKIKPDLTTLGKIIGGGMPVGAFGGREEIMNCLAPLGPVYQAGTLSGNPIAMTAGLTNLEILAKNPDIYVTLQNKTDKLMQGLQQAANDASINFLTQHIGSMFGVFFTNTKRVKCYDEVMACNIPQFNQFFHGMLTEGIYLAPASYEAGFMSFAHSDEDIEKTIDAAKKVFSDLKA